MTHPSNCHALFPQDQIEAAPMIQVFSTLPSIQYVGDTGWSRVREPSPLVIDRAILAEGCFAVPIPEAMVDSGIDSPHPILLEDFNGPDAPRHLMEAGTVDSLEHYIASKHGIGGQA
jgi:hypothetical protein